MQRAGLWSMVLVAALAVVGTARMAMAAAAAGLLETGTAAPNFTLPSQEDKQVSLSQYKGKWVVLYFYPKDQTQGCTIEAHNFQRDQAMYDKANAAVLGVSLDTADSHKAFCTKENLTFKLLADPEHKVVDEYGVPVVAAGPNHFAKRVTFLISPKGKIVKVWPDVKVQNHSEEVLAAITEAKTAKM
ncbi:peroxiredoxin [Terriglobus sp. TAA 43]|uniref:peroxiredoxin n=1 Tax=Terriglobus sp. TAA 43 TaxID=278961 RepID=UPI000647338E|nr:peroxiredoxin [Terriglobus sp. TAA 43]